MTACLFLGSTLGDIQISLTTQNPGGPAPRRRRPGASSQLGYGPESVANSSQPGTSTVQLSCQLNVESETRAAVKFRRRRSASDSLSGSGTESVPERDHWQAVTGTASPAELDCGRRSLSAAAAAGAVGGDSDAAILPSHGPGPGCRA